MAPAALPTVITCYERACVPLGLPAGLGERAPAVGSTVGSTLADANTPDTDSGSRGHSTLRSVHTSAGRSPVRAAPVLPSTRGDTVLPGRFVILEGP